MQRNFPVSQNKIVQPLLEKDLTDKIIGAAIEVHKGLGPGLLESAYQVCMEHESTLRNIPFQRLVDLPLNYKGINLDAGYEIDLIYDERVIVELKAVEHVLPVHERNCNLHETYGIRVGLLINFNVPVLKNGIYMPSPLIGNGPNI